MNSLGLNSLMLCRNFILSVWNKDVSRVLPLADFGVSDAPLVAESLRASLIRDIFIFLDQCVSFQIQSYTGSKCLASINHT